jgi:hypothetical protein
MYVLVEQRIGSTSSFLIVSATKGSINDGETSSNEKSASFENQKIKIKL